MTSFRSWKLAEPVVVVNISLTYVSASAPGDPENFLPMIQWEINPDLSLSVQGMGQL